MKVYEGTILTVDAEDTVCKYLVEDGGKVVFTGDTLPEAYGGAERVDLGKDALVPAFVDSHQHFASFALFHAGLNVMDATSNAEIMDMIADFAPTAKGKMLIAFGASPYSVKEKRLLSRKELDKVCPDRPMMVVKYDGHACIVNTPLLNKLRKKLEPLRGFHADSGEMNQEAFFAVSDFISNSISLPELVRNMQKAVDYEAAKGIGMIHSVSGVGFPLNADISMEKWFGRGADSGFQLRIFSQSLDIKVATKRGFPRIGGCFATALDGCFGSMDAALNEPYEGTDNRGVLYYDDAKVIDFCKEANRAGLQIEMHAIGDRGFDQAVKALTAALDDCPVTDHRHGIIHDDLPTAGGLALCGEYHIQMPMQTSFIRWPQEPDEYLETILGDRVARLNPLRTIWDQGIVISAGSDAPCTDPDPIVWLDRAVNHSLPEMALTIKEALRMCTYNGAYATFDEKERGSLEPGKLADMVRLSANPYITAKEELKNIKVKELLLAGKPYQNQSKGVISHILKGITSKKKI